MGGTPQVASGALLTSGSSSAKRTFNGPSTGTGSDAAPTDERLGAFRNAGMVYVRTTCKWNSDNSWSGLSLYDFGTERWFYGVPGNQIGTKYFGLNWNGTHLSSVPVVIGQSYTLVAELNHNSDVTRLWVDPATGSDAPAVEWLMEAGSWCTAVRLGSGGQTLWDDLTVATHWSDLGLERLTGLILYEGFEGYSATNLPTQATLGTGFRMGSAWSAPATNDSTVVTNNLVYPDLAVSDVAALCTTKGAGGVGTYAYLDLGVFDRAALLGSDTYRGTGNGAENMLVGGVDVEGTLYYSFLARSNTGNRSGAYAGLHLYRDGTEVCLVGNAWDNEAFSCLAGQRFDLNSANSDRGSDNFEYVDTETHLFVVKIDYHADASDDITVWLDPEVKLSEHDQNQATKTVRNSIGDLSFNTFRLRGGNSNSWSYDEIRFGTDWRSVLPLSEDPEVIQHPKRTLFLIN